MGSEIQIKEILKMAVAMNSSDIHLKVGAQRYSVLTAGTR